MSDGQCAYCEDAHRWWSRYCRFHGYATIRRQLAQQWVGGVVPTENFTEKERAEFARRGLKRIPGREDRDR